VGAGYQLEASSPNIDCISYLPHKNHGLSGTQSLLSTVKGVNYFYSIYLFMKISLLTTPSLCFLDFSHFLYSYCENICKARITLIREILSPGISRKHSNRFQLKVS
jgi:hypothetical protein